MYKLTYGESNWLEDGVIVNLGVGGSKTKDVKHYTTPSPLSFLNSLTLQITNRWTRGMCTK